MKCCNRWVRRVHAIELVVTPGRDRLDALALAIAEDPHRIDRERSAAGVVPEHVPDAIEILLQPLFRGMIHDWAHAQLDHAGAARAPFGPANALTDRIDPAF